MVSNGNNIVHNFLEVIQPWPKIWGESQAWGDPRVPSPLYEALSNDQDNRLTRNKYTDGTTVHVGMGWKNAWLVFRSEYQNSQCSPHMALQHVLTNNYKTLRATCQLIRGMRTKYLHFFQDKLQHMLAESIEVLPTNLML